MSLHYEFNVHCFVNESSSVVDFLKALAGESPKILPPDEIHESIWETFDTKDGWTFPGPMSISCDRKTVWFRNDQPVHKTWFSLRCHVHDDSLVDALMFVDWLATVAESNGFAGYFREEHSKELTLFYFKEKALHMLDVEDRSTRAE